MGSAAFLNEAINQLADTYMLLKQKELNKVLAPDEYTRERQKVKMLIADENVFGVDLNPIAVELAEVSLWLNSIHAGGFVPWFGMQLVTGNSLIGARRQMFNTSLLKKKNRGEKSWLDEVPKRYWPKDAGSNPPESEVTERSGMIYHFLVPDTGMANYKDKVVKQLAGENIKKINEWRKEFTKPFSNRDIQILEKLSHTVDHLWDKHTDQLRKLRENTTDPMDVFPHSCSGDDKEATSTRYKDNKHAQELLSKNIRSSSLYRRLKMAMDYWCTLWFWPIEKADLLPTRDEYLTDLQLILEGQMVDVVPQDGEQMTLFPTTAPKQEMLALKDEFGFVDVEKLTKEEPRLGLLKELAEKHHFLHWELEYADLFADNGGFDLILGNPPWVKIEWKEGGIMGDLEPLFVLRKLTASKLIELREDALESYNEVGDYLSEFEGQDAAQQYLNSQQNYPLLAKQKANLYKCFIPQAWYIGASDGIVGFLHPEGIYDDIKGGNFRRETYLRLAYHFQFVNELKLFPDVDHHVTFSINIYRNSESQKVDFDHIANLFAVSAVDICYGHNGLGLVGGIKDDVGKWNVAGHNDRIVRIENDMLALFARLYDKPGTPEFTARLPVVHAVQIIEVLRKFANNPMKLSNLKEVYLSTQHWNETMSQQDGTIRRETRFSKNALEWILSGPHFYIGTPFNKTPRRECTLNSHYDPIDLTIIPNNFLPRTNYVPNCRHAEYCKRTPGVQWDEKANVTDYYRLVFRGMLSQSGERTLICAVMPKGAGHVHSNMSLCFRNVHNLVDFGGFSCSIPFDFFIKVTGRASLYESVIRHLPFHSSVLIRVRFLLLVCLTDYFAELWSECFNYGFCKELWGKVDKRLRTSDFANLTEKWNPEYPLLTDYVRRQALIEIDVLVALALGITLDELCSIYRIQFPVLRQNENDTWYDRNGRIVFTCSKGLPGVGLTRHEWNEARDITTGSIKKTVFDDIMPDYREAHARIRLEDGTVLDCPCPNYPKPIPGPVERFITYEAPFDRCDREEDYRIAWEEFKRRGL